MVAFGSKSDPPDASFVIIIVIMTETHQMDSTGEQLGKPGKPGMKKRNLVTGVEKRDERNRHPSVIGSESLFR